MKIRYPTLRSNPWEWGVHDCLSCSQGLKQSGPREIACLALWPVLGSSGPLGAEEKGQQPALMSVTLPEAVWRENCAGFSFTSHDTLASLCLPPASLRVS